MINELNKISELYNEDIKYIKSLYNIGLCYGLEEKDAINKIKQFLRRK